MEFSYCDIRYSTHKFEDVEAGCAGLELFASSEILQGRIGKITFWDAAGQFFVDICRAPAASQKRKFSDAAL